MIRFGKMNLGVRVPLEKSTPPAPPITITLKATYRETDPQSAEPGDFTVGEKGGTVKGTGVLEVGQEYTVTATPKVAYSKAGGWDFTGWYDEGGTLISDQQTYTFTVEGSTTLLARFQKRWFTQVWKKNANVKSLTFEGPIRVPYYSDDLNTMTLLDNTDEYVYEVDGWYAQNGAKMSSNPSYSAPAAADTSFEARGKAIKVEKELLLETGEPILHEVEGSILLENQNN